MSIFTLRVLLVLLLHITIHYEGLGQKIYPQKTFFKTRDFGQYFLSDHYAPNVRVNGGLGLNLSGYNINTDRNEQYVFYNETVIGTQIPLYLQKWKKSSLAVSLPISMSVWFDFTEDITAPILNTDYRFGLMETNFIKEVDNGRIKNWGFKIIPFFHESTHIGDELTISRILDSIPITRVNVSFETFEFAFMVNDPKEEWISNHASKIGARVLWNHSKGWYSIGSYEAEDSDYIASKRWFEAYFQYQYQQAKGVLSSDYWLFMTSFDFSLRVQYGYPFYLRGPQGQTIVEIENEERYSPTFNLLLGWKYRDTVKEISRIGFFLRGYTGLNYHGQFRNIPTYQFMGFSLIYE
ncbi:hypothetical protein [Algivirga pacifica]|uniref:DUF4421 domain-containing protein n=1 Tax=Algivirga pacifica TaxID=1162670 RepID=A0ABP9D775_9BACT